MLGGAVRTVSGFTLLSRFAGLARDVITARLLGDDALGSAFRAAYALPNLFRRLFGEGALSAAFLPEYTLLRRDDPTTADELATLVVRLLTLVTSAVTLVLIAGLCLAILVLPHDADRVLSFQLMALMLPMMPAVCLTAVLGGMLQAHARFAAPAAAPILLNAFQIAAGLAFYLGYFHGRENAAYAIGVAAVLASVAQVVWSWWALRGRVRWLKAGAAATTHGRAVLRRFVPAMIGLGTLQLNTMMDMLIAMWPNWVGLTVLGYAVTLDEKSNAVLSYTQTIYQFPLGVFGIAVATAVFPMLSRSADRPHEFVANLRRGLRLSLFIGLPASVGLILVRHDMLEVIFGGKGRHSFSHDGVLRAAAVLAGFAPGVWAYSLNHVWTRAFYAKGDTTTPMRIAMLIVVFNFTLNITLIWWLREAGLAWATATAATVQCVILGVLCHTRLETPAMDRATWRAFARVILASASMGVCVWLAGWLLPATEWWVSWWGHATRCAVQVMVGAAVYAAAALLWRAPEIRWLLRRSPGGGGPANMSFE
jgi:putative peptidoglycan lipid II flippase